MSSSDSSEDDEESRRIGQAVIPDGFLFGVPSHSQETQTKPPPQAGTVTNVLTKDAANGKQKHEPQKSKRLDKQSRDQEENEKHGLCLKTTPEFRSYVEKHLSQTLDREVDTSLRSGAWEKRSLPGRKRKETGIKLFSTDKKLCLGNTVKSTVTDQRVKPKKIQPKKHRLRSSSESSVEDKISSCVFTVDDIKHENKMIQDLTSSGIVSASEPEKSTVKENGTQNLCEEKETDVSSAHKNKKMKKSHSSKLKNGSETTKIELNFDDNCETQIREIKSEKRKKKKKRKKYNEEDKEVS